MALASAVRQDPWLVLLVRVPGDDDARAKFLLLARSARDEDSEEEEMV